MLTSVISVTDGDLQFGVRITYVDELKKDPEVILANGAKHAFELSIVLRRRPNVKHLEVVYIKTIPHRPKSGWHECADCSWEGNDYFIHLQDLAYAAERNKP